MAKQTIDPTVAWGITRGKINTMFTELYDLIAQVYGEITLADITARDAYDVVKLPTSIFVLDDGDGRWALYKATTLGHPATFVKLSDPDLLNAVMNTAQIKAALGIATLSGSNTGDQVIPENYPHSDSAASAGTITLAKNTSLNLTTTLTNAHTLAITQGAPTANIANEWVLMFATGASVPTITFTPPAGVTYNWIGGAPTLVINKNYLLSIVRQSDTMYFAILQSN